MLTQARLKELIHYDKETGIFTWVNPFHPSRRGKIAGSNHKDGYRHIRIDGDLYLSHRLAWLYVNGHFPNSDLDHDDGIKNNNKFSNLRYATKSQNMHNRKLNSTSITGIKGVSYSQEKKKFIAQIQFNKKAFYLGSFVRIEDAEKAVRLKREELHGEFANHG